MRGARFAAVWVVCAGASGCFVIGGRAPLQDWGPGYGHLAFGVHMPVPIGEARSSNPMAWLDLSQYWGLPGGDPEAIALSWMDETSVGVLLPIGYDEDLYTYIGFGGSLFTGYEEVGGVRERATSPGFFVSLGMHLAGEITVTLAELRFSGGAPMELGGRTVSPTSITGAITFLIFCE
jgi:hypothetical protein